MSRIITTGDSNDAVIDLIAGTKVKIIKLDPSDAYYNSTKDIEGKIFTIVNDGCTKPMFKGINNARFKDSLLLFYLFDEFTLEVLD